MRPSATFALVVLVLLAIACTLALHGHQRSLAEMEVAVLRDSLSRELGLTDLCLATEARYTRHPALTDELAPFMDYPGALEHFPTGLFWAPP